MKKVKSTILISVGIFALVDFILFALCFTSIISVKLFYSIIIASMINLQNLLWVLFSIKKEMNANRDVLFGPFFKLMLPRIILMLILIIISLKFLDIYRNSFIFSILIFYIFCLSIEIKLLTGEKY